MSEKAQLNTIRVRCPLYVKDGQLALLSSISATHILPKGTDEQFSFGRDDLVVLKNRGEQAAVVKVEAIKVSGAKIVLRRSRGGTVQIDDDGLEHRVILEGGETLSFRAADAQNPVHNGRRVSV